MIAARLGSLSGVGTWEGLVENRGVGGAGGAKEAADAVGAGRLGVAGVLGVGGVVLVGTGAAVEP